MQVSQQELLTLIGEQQIIIRQLSAQLQTIVEQINQKAKEAASDKSE